VGAEHALAICANARCEAEIWTCEADDSRCASELACLESCSGNCDDHIQCATECFSHVSELDRAAFALGKCATERCVLKPFTATLANGTHHTPARPTAELALAAAVELSASEPLPDCPSVVLQLANSVRGFAPQATWISLSLEIDPYSSIGTAWLDKARIALDEQSAIDGYRYYLTGGDVAGHDMVNKVFELFPLILGIIIVVVFLLMAVAYRSIVVPFRAVFTIFLTLILVYGIGVLTYEHHLLEWTHFHAWINPVGNSLTWLVPALVAPVATGLSLDYDVFLLTRIFEYRHAGFRTEDSIMCGLSQTGGVITAAGIIMFFAFFGLSLSSNASLNQLSFFLCLAVVSDTFIIRTILVPACMMLLREANWYPSRPATLDYPGQDQSE